MTQPPQYPSYPGDDPQSSQGQQPQGSYPPPGYNPPPGQVPAGQYPPPGAAYPQAGSPIPPGVELAGWWSRVGAYLIDGLITTAIISIPVIVGAILAFSNAETDMYGNTTDVNPVGVIVMIAGFLIGAGFHIWNRGVRLGSRGQSLGKQVVGQRVVGVETGRPVGAGMGLLRLLLDYILSNACLLNVLWPLWDAQKQTWHDKIVKSVVIRA